ncbi:hypothetical protein Tco_0191090 [Tanacetum coccineum]
MVGWRVEESGSGDRINRVMGRVLELGRKTRWKSFPAAAVSGGGGARRKREREKDVVYVFLSKKMKNDKGTASRLRPYHFTYPERELTMEEIFHKFIDEGKREYEKMRAFINNFKTTNEILFKERNNSLIELKFEVQELLRVINNTPTSKFEIKGVITRGGKMTTQDIQMDDTDMNGEEPPKEAHDKPS